MDEQPNIKQKPTDWYVLKVLKGCVYDNMLIINVLVSVNNV